MEFNTKVKSASTEVKKTSRTTSGSGIIQGLLKVDLAHEVRLKDVLQELKSSEYSVKPMRDLIAKLQEGHTEQEMDEALLTGFFQNLASTGSFCYYRLADLAYNEEYDEHFLLKGAQVNCVVFRQGKHIKGAGTSPLEVKKEKKVEVVDTTKTSKEEESEEE